MRRKKYAEAEVKQLLKSGPRQTSPLTGVAGHADMHALSRNATLLDRQDQRGDRHAHLVSIGRASGPPLIVLTAFAFPNEQVRAVTELLNSTPVGQSALGELDGGKIKRVTITGLVRPPVTVRYASGPVVRVISAAEQSRWGYTRCKIVVDATKDGILIQTAFPEMP